MSLPAVYKHCIALILQSRLWQVSQYNVQLARLKKVSHTYFGSNSLKCGDLLSGLALLLANVDSFVGDQLAHLFARTCYILCDVDDVSDTALRPLKHEPRKRRSLTMDGRRPNSCRPLSCSASCSCDDILARGTTRQQLAAYPSLDER